MRPNQVLTYAVLGLAGSTTAQVDSWPESNDLVAREPWKPVKIVPFHGSLRSEDDEPDLVTRSKSKQRKPIRLNKPVNMPAKRYEDDEQDLVTREPWKPVKIVPFHGSLRSEDGEHDLVTRSKFKFKMPPQAPMTFSSTPAGRRLAMRDVRSVSDDDELDLVTRSKLKFKMPPQAPMTFSSTPAGRRLAMRDIRSVSEDDEYKLATRSSIKRMKAIKKKPFQSIGVINNSILNTRSPFKLPSPAELKKAKERAKARRH